MIVVNPIEIDYKRLAEVAARSRGKINRIYLHWTAGHYADVYDDYHINIGRDGELYITCEEGAHLAAQHRQHRHCHVLCLRRQRHPRKRHGFWQGTADTAAN